MDRKWEQADGFRLGDGGGFKVRADGVQVYNAPRRELKWVEAFLLIQGVSGGGRSSRNLRVYLQ